MASRVNTRFVVILVVGVVAMLGMVIGAYTVAFKSAADNIREGERLLAEGNIKQAERAFSKAVNKDTTNAEYLDMWINCLQLLVPETQTEYRDRYNQDLISAISKKATVLRDDVEAHEARFEFMHNRVRDQYSRGAADAVIEHSGTVLGFFRESDDGSVQPWERLKRYRGIAISRIASQDGILEDDMIDLGIDDLERVMQISPVDTESLVALENLLYARVDRTAPSDDGAARLEALRSVQEMTDSYLSEHPHSARMRLQRIRNQSLIARRTIDPSLPSADQQSILVESFSAFGPQLDAIADDLGGVSSDELNLQLALSYAGTEETVDPQSRYARTRRLFDLLIEKERDNASVLYFASVIANRAGDREEAMAWLEQIDDLETKPLSYEGMQQFGYQRRALADQCKITLDQQQLALTDDERARTLEEAKSLREEYAGQVNDDDLTLLFLDGRIAIADKQLDEALRMFARYNDLTDNTEPDGLWFEGAVASQLGQFGVARDALVLLQAYERFSRYPQAMITLGSIYEELQEYELASDVYARLLEIYSGYQAAIDANESLQRRMNPEQNEDPALAAIYTARQIRQGQDDTPGDYAGAIEYLREKVVELEYESRVSRELASLLLDRDDIEGTRELITRALEQSPDDEGLRRMRNALNAGNTTEILVQLLRDSPGAEIDRLLSIAGIASSRRMPDLLSDTVARLNEIDPNNKSVLEFTFVDAMQRGDTETAARVSQNPANTRVESLSYQARIAIAQDQPQRAEELLKQATASGAADASIFRLLGVVQRDSGQINDAIASFNQALTIRPDNTDIIREFIITLGQAGMFEQALNEARRYQRYASSDPIFMNLWLRLEAQLGGQQGRNFAIRQRERMLELNPNDLDNTYQLARLYILNRDWPNSQRLIRALRDGEDRLLYADLEATWFAEQGIVNGREGMQLAQEVFAAYIDAQPEPVGPEPYITTSQFMLSRGRPDLALAAAQEAVARQDRETMQGSILLGQLSMQTQNYSEAAKAFQDVLDAGVDDENQSVRASLIETLTLLQRYDEAQVAFDGFSDAKKSAMLSMIQGADIAAGQGDTARAQELLNQAVASYPNNATVYIKRAESMVGDPALRSDMLSDLNRALELDPNNWRTYSVRASGYFALDERDEALDDLIQSVRLNPQLNRSINAVLNELLSQGGRNARAESIAREIVSQRPNDARLMANIAGIFASYDDWEAAATFYEMAWDKRRSPPDGAALIDTLVRQSPPDTEKANAVINELAAMVGNLDQNSGLLAAQALVLQARGRDDFALQQITKAFDLSTMENRELLNWANNLNRYFQGRPLNEHITYLETLQRRNTNPVIGQWLNLFIAQRLIREDNPPQRAFDMLTALESSEDDDISIRAFRVHGNSLFNKGDFEGAFDVWSAGLARFSDDWEMNNNLAYTLCTKLDKPEEALPFGERAISQNIPLSEPYETMASIYIALGKYDEAEQMIETGRNFVKSVPASVNINLTAGRLAMKRGDLVEARSKIADSRSILRTATESYPILQADIDQFEAELDSASN